MDFERSNSKPHVAILASPGLGHLIPVIELGKRFVTQHNFNVTLFVAPSPTSKAEAQQLQSATTPKIFDIVELPPVDISNIIEPGTAVVRVLRVIMREIRQSLRSAIFNMQSLPNALIVDLFGTESMSIAEEFNMLKYIFLSSNASFLALSIYTPFLDKQVEGGYEEQKEVLRIPGCSPVRPEDVVDPMLDRSNLQYHEYVQMGVEMVQGHVDGFLLNTWEDLQPKEMKAFRDDNQLGRIVKAPVYPVGPLVRPSGSSGRSSARKLFDWLDIQPSKSVIYVSFGSGGTLSYQQVTEIAWGLELSQKRFVWVVRPPSLDSMDAAFFDGGGDNRDPCAYLPEGFTKRTQHVGILIPMWAPQMDILSHPSIGGFLSHCGWNSTLESLLNGVPMIAWPLYAEQRLNATLLTDGLAVAVRPKELPVKREVGREEIEEMVRKVMEDEKDGIRSRVNELKTGAEKALCKGGSSYDALSLIGKQCEQKLQIVE